MEFSLYHIISLVAFFNAIFLAVFSYTHKKGNLLANKFLGIIYFLFGLLIFDAFLLTYGLKPEWVIIFLIGSLFSLLLGPFTYFYTRAITDKYWKLKKKDALHFIAFFIFLSYVIIEIYVFDHVILWRSGIRKTGSFLIILHLLIYFTFSIKQITREIKLKRFITLVRQDNMIGYISLLLLAFILIWIIKLHSFLILDVWNRFGFCPYIYSIYFSSAFIFINSFMFINMRNRNNKNRKIIHSSLGYEDDKMYYRQVIDKTLNELRIYKDSKITLRKLSEHTKIPYSYLSNIINQEYGLAFRELINKYRIEEAKCLITNNLLKKQQTFIEIAYEVGFNSKSTFNLAFKKHTGMSPSEFLVSIKKSPKIPFRSIIIL